MPISLTFPNSEPGHNSRGAVRPAPPRNRGPQDGLNIAESYFDLLPPICPQGSGCGGARLNMDNRPYQDTSDASTLFPPGPGAPNPAKKPEDRYSRQGSNFRRE